MSAATWSIRNPIPAILLFLLLTLAGLWSFRVLDIQNFPDLDLPAVSVVLRLPGTAPAQLETEVARKIEDTVLWRPEEGSALEGTPNKFVFSKGGR